MAEIYHMRHNIHFNASFGDEIKKVELSFEHYGRHQWHLLIDNYHAAYIYYRDGEWKADLAPKSWLQWEDIQFLGELIENENVDGIDEGYIS